MRLILICLGLSMLAGCAADDPDNVPLRGEWEMQTRVTRLTVDGRTLPRSDFPQEFLAMETTEKRCGEPVFTDPDWQQRDLDRRIDGDCTLDNFNVTPTRVTGSGRCLDVDRQADFSPAIRLTIDQAQDRYDMMVTIEGAATLGEGIGRRVISARAVQEGRRLGDC